MSEVSAAAVVSATPSTPPSDPLRLVRRIGYALLGLQFAGFLTWSAILYAHFSVTGDYSTYNQPWYLIAHGDLDPYSTLTSIPFWRNDAELMPWVLAPLYWLFRSGITLPWLQDLSIAGAEAIAFSWICDVAVRRFRQRDATLLACLGLVLILADPWTWWAVSFDVHEEVLVVVFVALLARALARGKRSVWLWVVPVLLGGAPSASYVIGVGLGGMVASRRTRVAGAGLALAGIAWSLLIVAVHGDVGVPLPRHFAYLAVASGQSSASISTFSGLVKGIVTHPLNIPATLWSKRADMIANLAPGGLLGVGAPLLAPLLLVVAFTNTLSGGVQFAEPLFQSIPIYILMPVGTVMVLAWLLRRHRRSAIAVGCFLVAQAVGWAAVWGPMTPGEWLRVPGSTAETLASIDARIPASAEVIISQGEIGRFSSRQNAYPLFGNQPIPLHGKTWFIITPQEGIETVTPAVQKALIGELAGPLHATLIAHENGVWAFVWTPPPAMHKIDIPGELAPLPAWTSPGVGGQAVLTGPESTWHVTSTGTEGYVSDQLEWLAPPSRYVAAVSLSASGPVNVEVWDNTSNKLLARQTITATDGIQTITVPVNATTPYVNTIYSGWGPFSANFVAPPAGERLEVRVWSPGGTSVNVYNADLTPAASIRAS